ncbi:type III restriction-modification system endonuclease [Ilyobacter polytropus]|uniref:Type III site-specific deoxyribonuclease n=1 Tax=Ilyobacter polytropus (strain ATCC 51220 / DSM 2926 / LMG 16218 / CuHBu1) TaxID=572544 RepID=E3HBT1_ILYPC|nr:type III restriction-modification system endonuclease [Ilyobacter polytropus]ADO83843.1 Type III site-specific deoxyribonuclease [Ilyobacter polytropus DSM 2926]
MSKHLNFENNLKHQNDAIESIVDVFRDAGIYETTPHSNYNLAKDRDVIDSNIERIRGEKKLSTLKKEYKEGDPLILDIHMETGTGKTYTYTKTIFELNREYGLNKFIVVVPTLSIKAGTVNFLKSDACRLHFNSIYKKDINCLVVDSGNKKTTAKRPFPPKVKEYIEGSKMDKNSIYVLVINQGMINSPTIQEEKYDVTLFDRFSCCLDGISSTKPVIIIDEPHKFKSDKKTWKNLMNFNPQFLIRYGATFDKKYYDLVYSLDAIKAFNNDLVKGIVVNIEENKDGKNESIVLNDNDGKEAKFIYINELGKKQTFTLSKKDDFSVVHSEMKGLTIEAINKTRALLSNGIEMKKKDKLNPYSYSEILQEKMIREAIEKHFDIEEENMTKVNSPRIKTMSLFFIDSIESYRNQEDSSKEHIRIFFEQELERVIKSRIERTNNLEYKKYLEDSLKDIRNCHGGYFSKDNSGSDEKIEKEVNEILHDKESLLDLDNPRRFIFSKWTLREGWDNPNIFVICKLRGSGSETNKLQEVGRGLRIPVNEYMNRVTDKEHYLHYFVDFEEKDFVENLQKEINSGSLFDEQPKVLTDELLKEISKTYNKEDDDVFDELKTLKIIDRKQNFLDQGFERIKEIYPLVFEQLKKNKVRSSKDGDKKVTLRQEKYLEFKKLWEELNKKVLIKYDFKSNQEQQELLNNMILEFWGNGLFENSGFKLKVHKMEKGDKIDFIEEKSVSYKIQNMSHLTYKEFLLELEKIMKVPLVMIHNMFLYLKENSSIKIKDGISKNNFNLNNYLNRTTIREIQKYYRDYLIENSLKNMFISYDEVSTNIHPTTLTDEIGKAKQSICSSEVGVNNSIEKVDSNYLFNELYFDSEIEKENIIEHISEVVVFSKIPKNSIKIPVVAGGTYSPDFAYVVRYKDGKETLNLVVESKGKDEIGLSTEEKMKIKCVEKLFAGNLNIKFKPQFKRDEMSKIIRNITQ